MVIVTVALTGSTASTGVIVNLSYNGSAQDGVDYSGSRGQVTLNT